MEWSEPRPGAVRVEVRRGVLETVVRAVGELDLGTIDAFQRALPAPDTCAPRVVLDLSGVTFCAVVGAHVLARWRDEVEAVGGRVSLRRPQRAVLRVLEVIGLQSWCIDLAADNGSESLRADDQALTALLSGTMQRAIRVTGAPMGSAQRFEIGDSTLHLVAHHGFGPRFVDYFATVGGPATSCGAVVRDLRPVFVDNVLTSPVFAGAERDELLRAGVRAVASMPVFSPDRRLLGVFSTHYPRTLTWSPEHRSALLDIGRYAAAA